MDAFAYLRKTLSLHARTLGVPFDLRCDLEQDFILHIWDRCDKNYNTLTNMCQTMAALIHRAAHNFTLNWMRDIVTLRHRERRLPDLPYGAGGRKFGTGRLLR